MINQDKIKEILLTWEYDIQQVPVFNRDLIPILQENMMKQIPIVLHGIRRSGKTYLMFMLFKECEDAVYINFEDERLAGIGMEDLDELYLTYLTVKSPQRPVMFLDEIQNVKGWEKFVARLQAKVKFVISGSNASLLSSEYATALTGRHIPFRVHPLSFKEYLRAINSTGLNPAISEQKAVLRKLFGTYMDFGGFPEASLMQDSRLIKAYFESILYRDIIPRFGIQNATALDSLARYLVSNPGKLNSFRSLAQQVGLKHEETAKNYISYIVKSYLFSVVQKFDFSLHKQMANPKKVYPEDTGFVRHSGSLFSGESGRLLETITFNELIRRGHDVYYWRNERGKEVDFVVCEGLRPVQIIQVCERIENEKVLNRETNSLQLASDQLGVKDLLLLSLYPPAMTTPAIVESKSIITWLSEPS